MGRQTIKTLAAEIKRRWPHLRVTVERSHYSTDRKIGRMRWPGKGRWGSEIKVYDPGLPGGIFEPGKLLLRHNNAETYRHTGEVRRWIDQRSQEVAKKKRDAEAEAKDHYMAVRVPQDIWDALHAKVKRDNEKLSIVVRRTLRSQLQAEKLL